ncbi:MAG: hypothetical protein ACK2US_16230, partial [Anaerolineae bacterium]
GKKGIERIGKAHNHGGSSLLQPLRPIRNVGIQEAAVKPVCDRPHGRECVALTGCAPTLRTGKY